MRSLWLAAFLVVGCGGSDSPPYVGTWDLVEAHGCVLGIGLTEKGYFESDLLCVLQDGSWAVEARRGTYAETSGVLDVSISSSSCPDASKAESFSWAMAGANLRLTTADVVFLLERNPPAGSTTAAITYGCFAADGLFSPMPLAPLP